MKNDKANESSKSRLNQLHEHIPHLREQWIAFCEMVEKYGNVVVQQGRCDVDQDVDLDEFYKKYAKEEDPSRRAEMLTEINGEVETTPRPRYKLYDQCSYLNIPTHKGRFWIPEKLANPLLWLFGGTLPSPNEQEKHLCDCALLAIAHDENPTLSQTDDRVYMNDPYTGTYFRRDEFCKELWKRLKTDPERIERAFTRLCSDAMPGTDAGKPTEIDSETKQQQWVKDAPGYITIKEAGKKTKGVIHPRFGTELRKVGNTIRWMNKGKNTKVYEDDTYKYAVIGAPEVKDDPEGDAFVAGISKTKEAIKHANLAKKLGQDYTK